MINEYQETEYYNPYDYILKQQIIMTPIQQNKVKNTL